MNSTDCEESLDLKIRATTSMVKRYFELYVEYLDILDELLKRQEKAEEQK